MNSNHIKKLEQCQAIFNLERLVAQYSNELIEQVRYASDVVDIVSGYLSLRRKGQNYFGLCPFHKEKTPSFSVNAEMQIFHCFGCGAGGNVFTFIMKMEGMTFPESVKVLAKQAGIVLPEEAENFDEYREKEALYFANNLAAELFLKMMETKQAAQARVYLSERGITEDEYELFGIGWAPNGWDGLIKYAAKKSVKPDLLIKAGLVIKKDETRIYDRFRGRITFSIKNLTGQAVGFGARRIIEDDSPKYINSPETDIYQKRLVLYGLHSARDQIRALDQVIIVEGYTDVTSLYRANIKNTVATSGTALTEDHARVLARYTSNAILLYDADSAGAAAALRGADILLENGMEVKIAMMPTGLDPDEFARKNGEEEVKRLLASATPLMEFKVNRFEYESRYGSSTQKATATREILASITKVGDPIRRSFLVRDLAERLQLEESELWNDIQKMSRQKKYNSNRDDKKQDAPDKFFLTSKGTAEMGLLQVAMRQPDLIQALLKNINIDDITHHEIRSLFQNFQTNNVDPLTFKPGAYLTMIQDHTLASQLSHLMLQEDPHIKPWDFARDCLIQFQLALIDEKVQEIKTKIKPGATTGQDMNEMMDHLKHYLGERKKILQGEYIIGNDGSKGSNTGE
jgi:DNA primase